MSDSVVAQMWYTANGFVVLNVVHEQPNAEAIALLEPVVAAIEAYQAAVAELYLPWGTALGGGGGVNYTLSRRLIRLAQEIRQEHRERKSGVGKGFCVACREEWPCKPLRLAAELLDVSGAD